jgi:putative transposase
MARKPRFSLPGIPQHVIQRGNNREPCFYAEDDYYRYLNDLKEALGRNDCRLHAYVLMTNHVHLLLTPMSEHGVSHLMQDVGRKYVRHINHTYRRSGTLWEGRYKASLIDSEVYLLTCMRYIELNPLRANMVAHPGEYRWSSYACNANGKDNALIIPHPLYKQLGANPVSCQHAYRELFRQHMEHTAIHDIREALNQELVLGREDFKDRIQQMTQRQTRPGRSGRPRIDGVEEAVPDYYVL